MHGRDLDWSSPRNSTASPCGRQTRREMSRHARCHQPRSWEVGSNFTISLPLTTDICRGFQGKWPGHFHGFASYVEQYCMVVDGYGDGYGGGFSNFSVLKMQDCLVSQRACLMIYGTTDLTHLCLGAPHQNTWHLHGQVNQQNGRTLHVWCVLICNVLCMYIYIYIYVS